MFKMSLSVLLLLGACASYKPKMVDNKKTIKKDYDVVDASSRYRPVWIEDASYWAKKEKEDTKAWSYFSYEGNPRADRELACDLAQANVNAAIGASVKSDIEKTLNSYHETGQSALTNGNYVRSYIDRSLKNKIAQRVVGAMVIKKYWEKRKFLVKKGAAVDGVGFTCAVLAKIKKDVLSKAIDVSLTDLYKTKQGRETKAELDKVVKEVLK